MKIEIVGVQAYVTFLSENLEKSVIVDDVPKAIVRSECVESVSDIRSLRTHKPVCLPRPAVISVDAVSNTSISFCPKPVVSKLCWACSQLDSHISRKVLPLFSSSFVRESILIFLFHLHVFVHSCYMRSLSLCRSVDSFRDLSHAVPSWIFLICFRSVCEI